jgi:hypothetical protein
MLIHLYGKSFPKEVWKKAQYFFIMLNFNAIIALGFFSY